MTHLIGGISSAGRALPSIGATPLQVTRSQGPYLWDSEGKCYLDTALGFGASMLGHADPAVMEAACQALRNGPMPSFAHAAEEQAAAALTRYTGELSQVIFLNTGSEAVHLACRTAREATGRRLIAKFAAGYDGWYDQIAFGNAGTAAAQMGAGPRPQRDGIVLLRYNDLADAQALFREYPDIAAVLVEPVLANAGCIAPAPGYLKALSDLAHQHGALVILDEVLMGFRLHCGLSGTLLGAEPDLATLGKAIGSGIPVAALVGRPALMGLFEEGRIVRAGTYSGAPPACAAVLATLAQLAVSDYAGLLARGERLRERIAEAFAEQGAAICSSGYGTVFTCWNSPTPPRDYTQASRLADPQWTLDLHSALRRHGVMSMPSAYGRVYLTFAHDEPACEALYQGYAAAAQALLKR